jgi:hypothetical protein
VQYDHELSEASGHGEVAASASTASREVLLRIVESLQQEKAAMDMRLRAVMSERDRLEVECTDLRTANLEKDRQLALLLAGSDPFSLAPEPQKET